MNGAGRNAEDIVADSKEANATRPVALLTNL